MPDLFPDDCPECGAKLQFGFVSYGSGILWHKTPLRGFSRFFPIAFTTGRPIIGNWTSSGLLTSRPAKMCDSCGTVVLPRIMENRS